jgi:hypothetical protein
MKLYTQSNVNSRLPIVPLNLSTHVSLTKCSSFHPASTGFVCVEVEVVHMNHKSFMNVFE